MNEDYPPAILELFEKSKVKTWWYQTILPEEPGSEAEINHIRYANMQADSAFMEEADLSKPTIIQRKEEIDFDGSWPGRDPQRVLKVTYLTACLTRGCDDS